MSAQPNPRDPTRAPDPRVPASYPRRIVVASLGLAPQVLTETLYCLGTVAPPAVPFVPTEIHVVTTEEGRHRAALTLLDSSSAMLAALAPVCDAIVCTTPDTPRALDAADVAALARAVPGAAWRVRTVPQPRAALEDARRSCSRTVVAGSIFLIGPLRGILRAQ